MKTNKKVLIAAPVIGMMGLVTMTPAGAQAATADVVVVHGIPDTPVDVYVDDKLTLDNFTFGTVTDTVKLPAGPHAIAVRGATDAATAAPILSADATLTAGQNVSVVAHLNAAGQPTITPFVNDLAKVSPGQGRLVVRHTAAAPAVDVLAAGTPVFRNLTNPNEAKADLPAGTVPASVALAGTTAAVIGPADVPVTEGAATIVYATGSAQAGNLGVVVQSIAGLHSAPSAVNTGNSGLAAENSSSNLLPLTLVASALAGLVVVTGGRRLARQS